MTPIKNKFTNEILGAPQGWNELKNGPCVGLPVLRTEDPYVYSWWSTTWRERFAILCGRPIRLCVVGASTPPVSLDAKKD